MSKIFLYIFAFILCSCSTTNIKSKNNIPLTFASEEESTKDIKTSVTKEFFLWGMIPRSHDLYIDDALAKRGYDKVTNLVVTQKNRTSDIVWTILSFGVYLPQTFEISGKSTIK